MSQNFSYHLFFPSQQMEHALYAIAGHASGESTIEVHLPSGSVTLPWNPRGVLPPKQVTLVRHEGLSLVISLRFPIDDHLLDECLRNDPFYRNSNLNDRIRNSLRKGYYLITKDKKEGEIAKVGNIIFTILSGCRFTRFSFSAVTSSMSFAFTHSPSIRNLFYELLQKADGIVGLIDTEGQYYLLTDRFYLLDYRGFGKVSLGCRHHACSLAFPDCSDSVPDFNTFQFGNDNDFEAFLWGKNCYCLPEGRDIDYWRSQGYCDYVHHCGPDIDCLVEQLSQIVIKPARKPVVHPSWLVWNGGIVQRVAQTIHENRAFDQLPILGHALEEAGCTDYDFLNHFRQPGVHGRCCWFLDLLLGKNQ